MPFDNVDQFLRKFPQQWNDLSHKLATAVKMSKADLNKRHAIALKNMERYFDQAQPAPTSEMDENDETIIEMDSSSMLEFADNAIMARHDGTRYNAAQVKVHHITPNNEISLKWVLDLP